MPHNTMVFLSPYGFVVRASWPIRPVLVWYLWLKLRTECISSWDTCILCVRPLEFSYVWCLDTGRADVLWDVKSAYCAVVRVSGVTRKFQTYTWAINTPCNATYAPRTNTYLSLVRERSCPALVVRTHNETKITLILDPATRSGQPYGQRSWLTLFDWRVLSFEHLCNRPRPK